MKEKGYIKLYRSILNWEWFADKNVFRLFIYCLLRANHEEKNWQGVTINRGSFVTSYEKLAKSTGLSISEVRTALKKLKLTHELTCQMTSQYSIITVNNWNCFQQNDTPFSKQIANESQTNRKRIATNNNEKNEKNDKNEKEIISGLSQNSKVLNPDLMFDENVNKVFDFYEANCKELVPLKFEKRNIELRQAIRDFLFFIDFDFFYFFELCQRANKQVYLLDNKIDIKSLIKNHERIYSGFFGAKKADKPQQGQTTAEIMAKVRARKEANSDI